MSKLKTINTEHLTIKQAIAKMEEKHGKGVIMKLEGDAKVKVEVIPTGSIALDYALGVGGIPRGRIIEIYGPEASGKTTLALHIVHEAQKLGLVCAYIDAEHALDIEYMRKLSVDTKKLYISQPDSGEQALDVVESFVKTNEVGLIVIDSVAALTPIAEINGEMGASHMGLQARLMSQALRKLTAISSRAKTTIIFINQIRMNIGQTWGNPETTTGGKALKFYTSMRIEVRRAAKLMRKEEIVGNRVNIKVAKNKLASPFKTASFDIMFNEGISKTSDIVDFAIEHKIIKKEGITFSYGDEKIGIGLDKTKEKLVSSPELFEKLEKECRTLLY